MRNENIENMENLKFSYEKKMRICETKFIEKREIFSIFSFLRLSMIYPEKCVLSDKKENLVLPFSHFDNLFLSTLKNH